MDKKQWIRPELVILCRPSKQEAILLACKTDDASIGFNEHDTGCYSWSAWCDACEAIQTS